MQSMWAVVDLQSSKPYAVQVRAIPFEDDYYVEPGQTPFLSGKVCGKLLFKTREAALTATIDDLHRQQRLIQSQLHYLVWPTDKSY